MVSINGGLLALILFLGICACGLALFGVFNIRLGLRAGGSQEHREKVMIAWYKQPKVLFGINNIIFALIFVLVLLLALLASQAARSIVVGLIGCALVVSIVLVVLTVRAAIGTLQYLSLRQTQQKGDS